MDGFKDKVAIVTGGASGIGRTLCEEMAEQGAQVVAADIHLGGVVGIKGQRRYQIQRSKQTP